MPHCPEDLEAWVIDDHGTVLEIMSLPAEPPQAGDESRWSYELRLPSHQARQHSRILWEFKAGTAATLGVMPGIPISGPWQSMLQSAG